MEININKHIRNILLVLINISIKEDNCTYHELNIDKILKDYTRNCTEKGNYSEFVMKKGYEDYEILVEKGILSEENNKGKRVLILFLNNYLEYLKKDIIDEDVIKKDIDDTLSKAVTWTLYSVNIYIIIPNNDKIKEKLSLYNKDYELNNKIYKKIVYVDNEIISKYNNFIKDINIAKFGVLFKQ